ncbi:response regulator transcription factor [Anaeromicrobium sediminis]|nr:helix-turn-helix transcriptional regulator [Anaeromicrobium sediminis]
MKNRKKEFLFLALLYFLLIIDNSIIYISEFSEGFYLLYETSHILYIIIDSIYLGIILTTRLIILEVFNDKFTIREKQICIVLPVILSILSIFAPHEVSDVLIFISFFTALSYMAFRMYKHINNSSNKFNEKISKIYKIFLWTIITLNILGIIESIIYYIKAFSNSYVNLIALEYRFISFDIIKLFICIIGIKSLYSTFEKLFDKKSTDEKLKEFCIKYSLTSRQREIIELIIDGYSNKEISSKLHIAEGTVKIHIYNIFKKTDISSRNQMLKKIMDD